MVKIASHIVLCCFSVLALSQAADPLVRPVKARVSLELRSGGALLQIEADEFLEVVIATGEPTGARTLLPTRFRVVLSGQTEAIYTLAGPSEAPADWLSRHRVELRYDDQFEGSLDVPGRPDWESLIRSAPLRISIGAGDEPLVELWATSAVGPDGGAWTLTRSGASLRTEWVETRLLQEGRWIEGPPARHEEPLEPRYTVSLGGGQEGRTLRHSRLDGPEFWFEDEEFRVPAAMTSRRLIAGGEIEAESDSAPLPGVRGGFETVPLQIRWTLSVGEPPEVGWFEEVGAGKGGPWRPYPGGHRDFVVKLSRPELVEEVEIGLDDVSRHPGVALNGGSVVAARPAGWQDRRRQVPVEFREGETVLTWLRSEVIPGDSPEDAGPDLVLNAADHPGFAPSEPGRLATKAVKDEFPVRVRAADWAASGRLGVRVKVEGIWETLPAQGPSLGSGSVAISIPSDRDEAGVPQGFGGEDGDADGDGLSRAQEYRGVIAGGQHRRLSPERREVFLTDARQCLGEEERIALARRFSPWNVDLIFLDPGETGLNGVPVIVVEALQENFLPRLLRMESAAEQRRAFRAIRPRPGCGTLFVEGTVDPALLAGDLARILNLSELGGQP